MKEIKVKFDEDSGISLINLMTQLQPQLSPEALELCLEAIYALKNQPDCEKRNSKYVDVLNDIYDFFPVFQRMDWRNYKIVTFENVDNYENVFNELLDIDLHSSKKGRNGYTADCRMFIEHYHLYLDPNNRVDFLTFATDIEIMPDYWITLNTDWAKELGV